MQELLLSKGDLIALSHALEDALPSKAGEHAVLALFQKGVHFAVEADSYEALAQSAGTVVVGFAASEGLEAPAGVTAVEFDPDHPLSRVWALAVVGPGTSGALICDDLGGLIEGVETEDLDRQFRARWTFHRGEAAKAAGELIDQLGDLLPADVEAKLRRAVEVASGTPVGEREAALADTISRLLRALERGDQRLRRYQHALASQTSLAERDALTGAANRHGLRRAVAKFARDGHLTAPVGAMMIDLDDFKYVNDTFGHEVGDRVLVTVADRIRQHIRPDDVLVRFGGDEFLVLMPGAGAVLEARTLTVADALSSVHVEGVDRPVSASVGADLINELPLDLSVVDARMYDAKEARSRS